MVRKINFFILVSLFVVSAIYSFLFWGSGETEMAIHAFSRDLVVQWFSLVSLFALAFLLVGYWRYTKEESRKESTSHILSFWPKIALFSSKPKSAAKEASSEAA